MLMRARPLAQAYTLPAAPLDRTALDRPSVDELVNAHMSLAKQEADKASSLRRVYGDDEVLSAAHLGLFAAARLFDPARQGEDGFVAYARKAIRSKLIDCTRRRATKPMLTFTAVRSGTRGADSDDDMDSTLDLSGAADPHDDEPSDGAIAAELVQEVLGKLEPRHRALLSSRFGLMGRQAMTMTALARKFHWSHDRLRRELEEATGTFRRMTGAELPGAPVPPADVSDEPRLDEANLDDRAGPQSNSPMPSQPSSQPHDESAEPTYEQTHERIGELWATIRDADTNLEVQIAALREKHEREVADARAELAACHGRAMRLMGGQPAARSRRREPERIA